MSYNALDVSRYIINFYNDHDIEISNLKLQNLLYYIQAAFLVKYKKQAFFQNIIAWQYGVLIDDVNQEYKRFGSMSIPKNEHYLDFSLNTMNFEEIKFDENIIIDEHKEIINTVLYVMANKNVFKIIDIIQSQDPWIETYKENSQNIISNKLIDEYFSKFCI
jgi:uncharacterized phage-associated protein